jgi:hypothetical protein
MVARSRRAREFSVNELHRSFAAKDAAQDDIVLGYGKNKKSSSVQQDEIKHLIRANSPTG